MTHLQVTFVVGAVVLIIAYAVARKYWDTMHDQQWVKP